MAIIQFSDDPRTEFKLNAYKTKETLLEAIQQIAYKGGNTKTGEKGHDYDADFLPAVLCAVFLSHMPSDLMYHCNTSENMVSAHRRWKVGL